MIDIEDLIEAYMVARKNKRRSADQVEFELHWESRLWQLYQRIVSRSVQPTAYTFIVENPKPREVFASDMETRILHHYIDIRLRPIFEKRLSPHTFNNREGMGQNAIQNAVISDIYEMSRGYTCDAWIIKLDIRGCFPNIKQDVAYRQLEELVLEDYAGNDRDELLYMLQLCVYSYPTEHCYRKSPYSKWSLIPDEKSLFCKEPGTGAAIGHLLWQNAVNYYFHELDEWAMENGIRMERFVDDMYFVTDNKKMFLSQIPVIRKKLGELGASLNERKFYCQHWTKGIECVGVHIKRDHVLLNRRIYRNGILKVRQMNGSVRPQLVDHLLSSLNSYFGMMKNVNGYRLAKSLLREMNPKWFIYVRFNRKRVCLQARPGYSKRDLIIKRFKLKKHETTGNHGRSSASGGNHSRQENSAFEHRLHCRKNRRGSGKEVRVQ